MQPAKAQERPKGGPADAPAYTCPMHPEMSPRRAGACPICGMAAGTMFLRMSPARADRLLPAVCGSRPGAAVPLIV